MKFFTDKTVQNDYLLIKIKDYLKLKDFSKWKEVFIDPGVYELTKSSKYSWEDKINMNEFLLSLPENHYFSWDYPPDMNIKYTKLFLGKSFINALQYSKYSQYIVTVQFKFNNYWNFVEWFDRYNNLEIRSGILALGNLCRFRILNQFLKHSLDYAFRHCNHSRLHIYGLCLQAIPYAYKLAERFNIEFSIDSMKWTFIYYEIPRQIKDRQLYFELYKAEILRRIKS